MKKSKMTWKINNLVLISKTIWNTVKKRVYFEAFEIEFFTRGSTTNKEKTYLYIESKMS